MYTIDNQISGEDKEDLNPIPQIDETPASPYIKNEDQPTRLGHYQRDDEATAFQPETNREIDPEKKNVQEEFGLEGLAVSNERNE